ncbi:MAG: hypothetical protein KDI61_00525 [Alphaproteobacteria bacterium]|nr:hypothetical protein [Alphaproteobacteria bacterium]
MTQTENNTTHYNKKSNPRPDKIARIKQGSGKSASFETVGVAWTREDGSLYFKPYGKQVIDQPIYLFDISETSSHTEADTKPGEDGSTPD